MVKKKLIREIEQMLVKQNKMTENINSSKEGRKEKRRKEGEKRGKKIMEEKRTKARFRRLDMILQREQKRGNDTDK